MICKRCKKNVASVKFTEVVDGQVVQHQMCPECLLAYQRETSGFSCDVPKPTRSKVKRRSSSVDRSAQERCSSCGISMAQVMETGSVGCAGCYTHFGKEIESIIEGLHRGSSHRGKTLRADSVRATISSELQAKRRLLRSMLKEEKYEAAAVLRDEIATLETQVISVSEERCLNEKAGS